MLYIDFSNPVLKELVFCHNFTNDIEARGERSILVFIDVEFLTVSSFRGVVVPLAQIVELSLGPCNLGAGVTHVFDLWAFNTEDLWIVEVALKLGGEQVVVLDA